VHAVGRDRQRQRQIVVDQQTSARLAAQPAQGARSRQPAGGIGILVAILHEARTTAQCRCDRCEVAVGCEPIGGDRVEAAQRLPFSHRATHAADGWQRSDRE